MFQQILIILISCLFFTIAIETSLALILQVRNKKDLINVILVNVITNPIVVILPYVVGIIYNMKYRLILLAILELWAFLLEGFFYKKYLIYKKINPYILSLILNICSYLLGDVINKIIY